MLQARRLIGAKETLNTRLPVARALNTRSLICVMVEFILWRSPELSRPLVLLDRLLLTLFQELQVLVPSISYRPIRRRVEVIPSTHSCSWAILSRFNGI